MVIREGFSLQPTCQYLIRPKGCSAFATDSRLIVTFLVQLPKEILADEQLTLEAIKIY